MALAETFLRKVYKLGLLPKIVAKLPLVSILFAVASVAWLMVLPMDGQYRHTYISENALMPGQVTSYFRESEWNYVRGFRSEVRKWDFETASQWNPALETWLTDYGLDVSHHHDPKTNLTTMYAVMHAPRGDNTEALVLAVPYYTSDGERNIGGFSLAPALARYFARMSIWSKNIILVFPRDSHTVLRNWVEAYHTLLDVTAGSIEAAIVMEYASDEDTFSYMEIFYEGLNGQLPNLDLINTATAIARNENMKVSVQGTSEANLQKNDYMARLRVLARGIISLAISGIFGKSRGCESFSGWQIQAITVKAVGSGGPDITQFGRIVDSTFRSVNNLLEKFHQSFFFYLLLSPTHFVSIGTYLPSAALIAASFAISSLYSFACGVSVAEFVSQIANVLIIFTGVEAVSLVGALLLQSSAAASMAESNIIKLAIISLMVLTCLVSLAPVFRASSKGLISRPVSYMLLSFSLYFIAMLVISLLIVHYALAFSIGVCSLPLTFIQTSINESFKSSSSQIRSHIKICLCLLLSSPVTALVVLGFSLNGISGILSLSRGLFASWKDMQGWTWFVISLGWFPAWVTVGSVCAFGEFELSEKEKKD